MRAFTVACLAALALAVGGGAQEPPVLSEADFLSAIDAAHPATRALLATLGEAEAAALGARALRNPELDASRESPEGATRQLDVTLRWQPPRPDRRRLSVASADAGLDAARAGLAYERSALVQEARASFATWAVATATSDRLAALAAQVDRLAQRERSRADSGEASGLDARRLSLAAVEARGELARMEAKRRAADALARVWRRDLPAAVRPMLPLLPAAPVALASTHPRIAALTSELESARASERLAQKIAELPVLVSGWQRQELAGDSFEGPLFGLTWPLPLLDRKRADRTAARARVASLEARLALSERQVAASRAATLAAYEELRRAAEAAGAAATEAPAIVAAASAAFVAGEIGVTDLLDALRSATAVEVRTLELHAEALAAHRALELAALPTYEHEDGAEHDAEGDHGHPH